MRSPSICSAMAVAEKAATPVTKEAWGEADRERHPAQAEAVMPSCANPRPKMSFFIDQRWDSLSSKADDEEQQNDTELCHGSDGLRVPDEAQAGWPDDDPGREVARGRRSASSLKRARPRRPPRKRSEWEEKTDVGGRVCHRLSGDVT